MPELLHPGCTELAWDGAVLAAGLGRLWRLGADGRWLSEPLRPLHAVHHEGPQRPVEVHGAYVYTDGPGGWRATARVAGDEVLPHPSGAVAFVRDGVVHRAALPGRTPCDMPELRADALRFGPRGQQLFGLGTEGPVAVELPTGAVRPLPGIPLGAGTVWVDGAVLHRGQAVATGLRDASPAIGATHVAGPGGRLWSRATREPSGTAPIALGATVAVGTGFATVPYEGPEGWLIDAKGHELARFEVPLETDDLVMALSVRDGALWAETAEGKHERLLEVDAEATSSPRLRTVMTPLGPVPDALQVDGLVVGEAGWLLAL